MSPVAIPADRRFHRAHVKPARKRGRLRSVVRPLAKSGLFVSIVLLLVYRGGAVISNAPMLQISEIVVLGNHRLPEGEVLTTLEGMRGENIVWTDLTAWRDVLLTSPWVQDATFRRSLPSTIEVTVAEREPIGIGRVRGRLYLVDQRGGIIDEYGPQYSDFDLPIIDGLAAAKPATSDTDAERGELAARLIVSLKAKPNVARLLSQVDVSDLHNASVILNGDQAVIYVGDDRFLSRLESYLDLAPTLRERVEDIDYVDLRFDDRIYVRPASKAARAAALRRISDAGRPAGANAQEALTEKTRR